MTDKFLRKILNITTILFAIILFGCVENSTSASTESETIVNETSSISAGDIFYSSFNAKSKVTIHVDVQVTNGDGVKIYLLDDYTQLINLSNNNYFNWLFINMCGWLRHPFFVDFRLNQTKNGLFSKI